MSLLILMSLLWLTFNMSFSMIYNMAVCGLVTDWSAPNMELPRVRRYHLGLLLWSVPTFRRGMRRYWWNLLASHCAIQLFSVHKLLMRYVDDCYLIAGFWCNKTAIVRAELLSGLLSYFEESWLEFTRHFAAMFSSVGLPLKVEDPSSFIGFEVKIADSAAVSLRQLLPVTQGPRFQHATSAAPWSQKLAVIQAQLIACMDRCVGTFDPSESMASMLGFFRYAGFSYNHCLRATLALAKRHPYNKDILDTALLQAFC